MLELDRKRRSQLVINGQTYPDCIPIPRLPICTEKRSLLLEHQAKRGGEFKTPPPPFKTSDFLTLEWLVAGAKPRAPKNVLHIGNIDAQYFQSLDLLKDGRPHYVAPGKCPWTLSQDICPFQIYHYSGSSEQRTFRQDPRGEFGQRSGGSPPEVECADPIPADDLLPWLEAFVISVGLSEAKRLLDGAGRVHSWPPYQPTLFG